LRRNSKVENKYKVAFEFTEKKVEVLLSDSIIETFFGNKKNDVGVLDFLAIQYFYLKQTEITNDKIVIKGYGVRFESHKKNLF
jgi:hypothetical protein